MKDLKLDTLSVADLVTLYNKMTGKEIKGFSQKSVGIEQITKARMKAHELVKALCAKTVENGTTEHEEMASWSKAQEMIQRYSLDSANYPLPAGVKKRSDERKAAKAAKETAPEAGMSKAMWEANPHKKAEAPKAEAPKPEAKKTGRIVRVVAEDLLMKVDFVEDGKPYGLPYEDILRLVKEEFPNGKTSLACLRWYAVQLREHSKVPARPRAQKKEKA